MKKGIQKIRDMEKIDLHERPVCNVSMGCHVKGVALPHVDLSSGETLQKGVERRMGKVMPKAEPVIDCKYNLVDDMKTATKDDLNKYLSPNKDHTKINHGNACSEKVDFYASLRKYVTAWCMDNLTPLAADVDQSIETWLKNTHYPEWRVSELRELDEQTADLLERVNGRLKSFDVKLFCKDETYTDFKHARGIYAREDVAKLYFGPFFKLLEEELYKHPAFIKHVPVKERGKYIMDMLFINGGKYVQTDYSSYESHFSPELMENCEFVLYEYMFQNLPNKDQILGVMREVLQGDNKIVNKFFTYLIRACRMSGEMNTSLGNGFSNLMLMSHQCYLQGLRCVGVVEGDDGLFSFADITPRTEDFTAAGCIIKLEVFDEISDASFCGLLFDREAMQIVTDPREVLAGFGWTTKRYAAAKTNKLKSLLRCKALSYITQYPGCPIIASLAKFALRNTSGLDVRHIIEQKGIDMWEREQLRYGLKNFKHNLDEEIHFNTRLLVERNYNIPVSAQIKIEQYLDAKNDLDTIDLDFCNEIFLDQWKTFYENYVVEDIEYSSNSLMTTTYPSHVQRDGKLVKRKPRVRAGRRRSTRK